MSKANGSEWKKVSSVEWVRVHTTKPDPAKRVLPSPANQGSKTVQATPK